ncbi:MAG: hypothetical protein M1816_004212 [Peltula sp. TS41687]|nr:MAG: hypothetical protein M1816_004212 [Peltula sp. TS41687]
MPRSPRKRRTETPISRIPLTDVRHNQRHLAQKDASTTSLASDQEAENWTRTRLLGVYVKKTRSAVPLKEPGQSSAPQLANARKESNAVVSISARINTSSSRRGGTTGDDLWIWRKGDDDDEDDDDDSGLVMQENRRGRASTQSVERQVPHEEQPYMAKTQRPGASPGGKGAKSDARNQPALTPTKRAARTAALGTPVTSRVLRSHTKAIKFANLGSTQPKVDGIRSEAGSIDETEQAADEAHDSKMRNPVFSKSIFESEEFSMISESSLPTIYEGSNQADVYSPTFDETGRLSRSHPAQTRTPSLDPALTILPILATHISYGSNLMTADAISDKASSQEAETTQSVPFDQRVMASGGVAALRSQEQDAAVLQRSTYETFFPSIEENKGSKGAERLRVGAKRDLDGGLIVEGQPAASSVENQVEAVTTPQEGDDFSGEDRGFLKSSTRSETNELEFEMAIDEPVTYPKLPLEASPRQSLAGSGKEIPSMDAAEQSVRDSRRVASISGDIEEADTSNQMVDEPTKWSITKELDSLLFPDSQSSSKGEEQQSQIQENKARSRPKKKGLEKDIWQLEAEVGRQTKRRATNARTTVSVASPRQGDDEMKEGVEVEINHPKEPRGAGETRRERTVQRAELSKEKHSQVGSDHARLSHEDQFLDYAYSLKTKATANSSIRRGEQKEAGDVIMAAMSQEQTGQETHEAMMAEKEQLSTSKRDDEPIRLPTGKETSAAEVVRTTTIQEEPRAPLSTISVSEPQTIPAGNAPVQNPTAKTIVAKSLKQITKTTTTKSTILGTALAPPPYKVLLPRLPIISSSKTRRHHHHYHHQHTHRFSKSYRPSLKVHTTVTGHHVWTDGHYIHLKRLYKLTPPTSRAVLFTPTPTTPSINPKPAIPTTTTTTSAAMLRIKDTVLSWGSWLFPASSTAREDEQESGMEAGRSSSILHRLIALPKPVSRGFYVQTAEADTIRRYLEDVRRASSGAGEQGLWDEEYVAGRLLRLRVGEERRGGGVSRGG